LSFRKGMSNFNVSVDDSGNYHVAVDGQMLETVRSVRIRAADSLSLPRCTVEYFPTGSAGARTQQLLAKVPWVRAVALGVDVPAPDSEDDDMEIQR
jgi:hypothetical protein